uniref:AlNc14C128G6880 protein n=1 Tax=Albugo laibachii Nc14 TaxID=890382 RepID=F0WK26_9STRA|nr:AlNc14C128G6880 [Albugo laibachii Nc14]|eukprot:CCA21628.1 AlNc14C128G6880 [Albugo laibachii Nc14]
MSFSFFDINYISLHFILFADIVLSALVEYETLFTSATTLSLTFAYSYLA